MRNRGEVSHTNSSIRRLSCAAAGRLQVRGRRHRWFWSDESSAVSEKPSRMDCEDFLKKLRGCGSKSRSPKQEPLASLVVLFVHFGVGQRSRCVAPFHSRSALWTDLILQNDPNKGDAPLCHKPLDPDGRDFLPTARPRSW